MTPFFRQYFHHHDVQSVSIELKQNQIQNLLNRKNTQTGASAASSSKNFGDYDYIENELVLSCPSFRNEIPTPSTSIAPPPPQLLSSPTPPSLISNQNSGSFYYRNYFYPHPHENYYGIDNFLGPIAISLKKEISFWRVIFRTSEIATIRGSVGLETEKSRDVIEFLFPSVKDCLKLGLGTSAEILLKLDEQNNTTKHKVGVLYCRQGQQGEEDFYNNEFGGVEFERFLVFLGDKVRLKGFGGYSGGLDCRDDTTGTHSIYRQYKNYELMFHVSTLLPFTPNNRQQLMRKRHIGNDIVTIIFQEPGSLPFTPKSVRSQFQHVFIVVRVVVVKGEVCYGVSISRSTNVPEFGPKLTQTIFKRDDYFLEFLLAKVINAENATYNSDKFVAMATRTRNAYLNDLCANYCVIDGLRRFSMLNLIKKKPTPLCSPTINSSVPGALSWQLPNGYLAISSLYFCVLSSEDFFVQIEDVVAWDTSSCGEITFFYIQQNQLKTITIQTNEINQITKKLKQSNPNAMETEKFVVKRKLNLGFHIQNDGLITDVDRASPAGVVGVRSGSRVVKINNIQTSTLNSDQMIALLKSEQLVELTLLPPEVASLLPLSNKHQLNHLNLQIEGSAYGCSPQYHYCSSSGYGTGSSRRSYDVTPPPLPERRKGNFGVWKSSENLGRNYLYDFDITQRVTQLKNTYLRKPHQTSFERDLKRLIVVEDDYPSYTQSLPTTPQRPNPRPHSTYSMYNKSVTLEARVALLETQLKKEQQSKDELKRSMSKLEIENKRIREMLLL